MYLNEKKMFAKGLSNFILQNFKKIILILKNYIRSLNMK